MNFPTKAKAIEQIIDIGKRMYIKGFVAANDGNISCKIAPDVIVSTPTLVSKGFMTEDMMVVMDLDGNILEGTSKPSSEVKMHIRAYKENPEINAVTHAHPPASSAFAIAGIALDRALMPEAVVNLGPIPIAKYADPGSQEVPDSIAPFVKDYNGVLLANHGALTWGKDVTDAFYKLESVEYYAKITIYTDFILGKANILSEEQIKKLFKTKEKLGIKAGGIPPCSKEDTNAKDVLPGQALFTKQTFEDELAERIAKKVLEKLK